MRSAIMALALALAAAQSAMASVPAYVGRALGDARLAGNGRLTWLGLQVYDARLFVPARGIDPRRFAEHPFALELTYARSLKGHAIAERSHAEIARLGFGNEEQRDRWRDALKALLPDVRAGQQLAGVNVPGHGAEFFLDGRPLGRIDDVAFAAAFFAIWLDTRSTAPELRASLLQQAS